MKKLTLAAALSALVFTLPATAKDLPQGTIAILGTTNGELGFTTTEIDEFDAEFDTTVLNINLGARYFIQDNIAIGLGYSLDSTETEYEGGSEEEDTTVFLSPGVFYNLSLDEENSVILGAEFGFGSQELSETGEDDVEIDMTGFSFRAEYNHFINDFVALNAGAAYTILTLEEDTTGIEADTSGLFFGFGVSVYLSK